jgi:RHS repeat-associated protein
MPGTTNRYRNLRPGGHPFRVIPSFRALFQHRNGLFGLASRSGPFRNGTSHSYSYDVLSRQIADAVTTLGSGVDGTVRRITTGYSPLNTPNLFTSYDAASGGNVVNQVKDEFNGLGQVTKEWQEHSGAVTGTSANVQYAYSEMAGGANHSRLTSITYASGYVLNYNYGSGLDSTISRLTSLSDSGNTLESYSYLGLATIVKRGHAQSGVNLSYIKLTGESVGDAGDQYTGLDRFQRIVDQRWINGSNVDVDRYKYGYDRNGNCLFKENVVIASLSEVYTYDGLNQIGSYKQGTLNTGKTDVTGTPTNAQSWDYDAVGNWDSVTTNSVTQTRGANRQNEITSVSGATTPTYDNNGNLTKDENDNRFVWDAWNMMVQVKNSSNVVIVTMGRDALHRHVTDTEGTSLKDRFFGLKWRLFETKAGSNTVTRNVWSPAYVDAMVLRDRDTDNNGTLDERLYSLQDANWNTTGLVNTSGIVVERYTYPPFGVVTFRDASGSATSGSSKDWVCLHQGGEKIAAGDYEFRNRIYSPTLGRWLSNDPIGFSAGDVNTFRYVGNGPGNGLDPSGLETIFFHGKTGEKETPKKNSAHGQYRWTGKFGSVNHYAYNDIKNAVYEAKKRFKFSKFEDEPIIVIGHSWGGDSAIKAADDLIKSGYQVDLLITIDPVTTFIPSFGDPDEAHVNHNIKKVYNFRQDVSGPRGAILKGNENIIDILNPPGEINQKTGMPNQVSHTEIDDAKSVVDKIKDLVKDTEAGKIKPR